MGLSAGEDLGLGCGISARNFRKGVWILFGVVEKGTVIGACTTHLAERGLRIEQVTEYDRIPEIVERAQKEYLTPVVSPVHNDLTQGNCIWLVAWLGDQPAMVGGARLEALGAESVSSFWPRSLGRMYGREPGELIHSVSSEISSRLNGNLAYFGDLHVNPSMRGMLSNLRAFIAIGHMAVSLNWDPDFTYAFVREADVMRGAAARYGFLDVFPQPMVWNNPPKPRSNGEWCGVLPRDKLRIMATSVVQGLSVAPKSNPGAQAIRQQYESTSDEPVASVT